MPKFWKPTTRSSHGVGRIAGVCPCCQRSKRPSSFSLYLRTRDNTPRLPDPLRSMLILTRSSCKTWTRGLRTSTMTVFSFVCPLYKPHSGRHACMLGSPQLCRAVTLPCCPVVRVLVFTLRGQAGSILKSSPPRVHRWVARSQPQSYGAVLSIDQSAPFPLSPRSSALRTWLQI